MASGSDRRQPVSDNIERNNALYPEVYAGEPLACEAMILNNLGLVVVKAASLIRQRPRLSYLRDDLVSAGNVGLVTAVNRIGACDVCMEAVNTCLGKSIDRYMLRLLPRERGIHVPQRSCQRARHNSRPIAIPRVQHGISRRLEAPSELRVIDLRDVIQACCQSDQEKECLRLREEGYTLQEISAHLGLGIATVMRMIHRLRKHISAYWTSDDPRNLS
jgi:RNA polymerase sigma factor (sigma-70 family)